MDGNDDVFIPGDTLLTLIENPLIEKIRVKPLVTSVSSERIQQIRQKVKEHDTF